MDHQDNDGDIQQNECQLIGWIIRSGYRVKEKRFNIKCKQLELDPKQFLKKFDPYIVKGNPIKVIWIPPNGRSWIAGYLNEHGFWPLQHHGNPSPDWRVNK